MKCYAAQICKLLFQLQSRQLLKFPDYVFSERVARVWHLGDSGSEHCSMSPNLCETSFDRIVGFWAYYGSDLTISSFSF